MFLDPSSRIAADFRAMPLSLMIRWAILIALLAAEVIGLTIRFDSRTAAGKLPELLLGLPSLSFRLLVALASVALLLYGVPSVRGTERRDQPSPGQGRYGPAVLVHLGAFGAFTWLTMVVLEGPPRLPLPALGWAFAWSGLGVVTLVSWVAIGLSPSRWVPLLKRGPGLLLVSGAVGLGVWGAGRIAQTFWSPLGRATLGAVDFLLRGLVASPVCDLERFVVGTPNFQVEIAPVCSGYEGMALVLVLVGTYLWVARQRLRFPRALLLLPLGIGVIWVANVLRITALIALGDWGMGSVALGGFHSQAGWLAFDAIGLGLVLIAGRWSFLQVESSDCVARDDPNPSSPYLVPFLALVGTSMITGAFASGFEVFYPLRLVTAGGVLLIYRRRYGELRWTFSAWPLVIGCGVFVLWMALEPLSPARWDSHRVPGPWLQGLSPVGATVWLAARVGGSVLIVPLVEELAFRGYLTRRLISPESWSLPIGIFSWPSFLISSALFGFLHDRWLAGTLAGMLFGLALYRRGRLVDAVLAHATTNFLIAAWVLASGDWSLWL